MTHEMDLARDLVIRERATSAALDLDAADGSYTRWARHRRDQALEDRTQRLLQAEVSHLLNGLRSLLHDDYFWASFRVQPTGENAEAQLRALQGLGRPDLATMFELVGYSVPPPPPATELVDAATTALAALDPGQLTETQLASAVQQAQEDLTVLLWRAQRQIDLADSATGTDERDASVRTAARTALRGARTLLPAVTGAATAVAVTSTGGGPVAGAAAGKLAEKLLVSGLGKFLGSALLIGTHAPDPPLEHRAAAGGFDSIALHLSRLRTLQEEPWTPEASAEVRQHIIRLADLLDAGDYPAGSYLRAYAPTNSDEADVRGAVQHAIEVVEAAISGNYHQGRAMRSMRAHGHGRGR